MNKQETLEEDLLDTAIQIVGSNNVTTIREFLVKHKWQQERMYSDLSELRNDLYDKLPIGDVDAFEILKVIKNHLQKLDALCGNK